MPIRKDLLPLYKTPEYKAARDRIVERAGNCCEQCKKPNGQTVETVSFVNFAKQPFMLWRSVGSTWWCWHSGKYSGGRATDNFFDGASWRKDVRSIRVVLTLAHLDHNPTNNADSNLKFLCQWCHLNYDKIHHRETRSTRKDSGRPLLTV